VVRKLLRMAYTKQEALQQFERWSDGYDRSILQRLLFGPSHDRLLKLLEGTRPHRVLDVGCGTGRVFELLAEGGTVQEVWGLDLSGSMLKHGVARLQRFNGAVRLIQGDSERLPLEANTFDVVTCSNCFHHFPDQERAVREMHRVLKPNGMLLIIDGYRDGVWGRFLYDFCVVCVEGPVHHASARRFRELFTAAGFVGIRQEVKLGLAPFLLTVGIAHKEAPAEAASPEQLPGLLPLWPTHDATPVRAAA
jgi:ubiquinone/menaquinone biosynthesis C-methylase UbiE